MGGGNDNGEARLSFVLPTFPVSCNRLYLINHRERRVMLSNEALLWRTRTTPFVKPCCWPVDWLLKLTLIFESPNWHAKNGNLKRQDMQNLEKLLIDTLFLKWGWDDSRLAEKITSKRYGPQELIRVTLERSHHELNRPV